MNTFISKSLNDTASYAKKIASYLNLNKLPAHIALDGDLGAGKTTFTKSFVSFFNKNVLVNSPTYTIINDYSSSEQSIYHCDLYRINSKEDLNASGFYEILDDKNNIIIVEWANKLSVFDSFVNIYLKILDTNTREIKILNRGINL